MDCQENRQNALYSVVWIFWGIASVIVLARIYTRAFLLKDVGWDDIIMVLSWLILGVESCLVNLSTQAGLGRHMECLSYVQAVNAVKFQSWAQVPALVGDAFGRIAVSILIVKVLNPSKAGVILLWFINVVFSCVFSFVVLVVIFTRCNPVQSLWDPSIPHTCKSQTYQLDLGITSGSLVPASDFILALYPATIISNLQLSTKKKVGTCILMGLGILAGIVGAIRTPQLRSSDDTDFTWATVELICFVQIEGNLIIICGSVPTLGPLLRKLQDRKGRRAAGPTSGSLRAMRNPDNRFLQMGAVRKNSKQPILQDSIAQLEQAESGGYAGGLTTSTAVRTDLITETDSTRA